MYARKMGPFIAPSITNGATIPSWRKPATKVIVFQCPWGTDATRPDQTGWDKRRLDQCLSDQIKASATKTW